MIFLIVGIILLAFIILGIWYYVFKAEPVEDHTLQSDMEDLNNIEDQSLRSIVAHDWMNKNVS